MIVVCVSVFCTFSVHTNSMKPSQVATTIIIVHVGSSYHQAGSAYLEGVVCHVMNAHCPTIWHMVRTHQRRHPKVGCFLVDGAPGALLPKN